MSKETLCTFVSHSIAVAFVGAAAMLPMAAMATVTVYVGGDGASDDNAGTSSKPYATIEKAMDKVNAEGNANDCKVYVRAGTYNVTAVKRFNKGQRIGLIGETGNPADVVIDGGGTTAIFNGSGNVVSGLTVCNVTIQNATGTAVDLYSTDAVVSNCVFKSNTQRALAVRGNSLVVDCVFEDNGDATLPGAAIFVPANGTIVRRCSFVGNRGSAGGAVAGTALSSGNADMNTGYQIGLDSCAFTNNFSATLGGAFCGLGGNGIVNCDFVGNVASNQVTSATGVTAPNVVARGGAIAFIGNTLPASAHVVSNCTFTANTIWGDGGSALFTRNGEANVSDCTFLCNTSRTSAASSPYGGAVLRHWITGSNLSSMQTFERCVFDGNVADGPGASIGRDSLFRNCLFVNNENKSNEGGALRADRVPLRVESCTFAGNKAATYGGAVALTTFSSYNGYGSILTNCLFVLNEALAPSTHAKGGVNAGWADTGSWTTRVVSFYNCMEVVSQEDYDKGSGSGNPAVLWLGTGATDCANKVVAGTLADFFIDAANGDYTTLKKSPARNAGVNHGWMASATDIIGKARINAEDGSIVDIGCYEWYNLNPPGLMIFVR